MIKGTVKFFNDAKGFGFISPDDGGKDVFLPAATITASGAARLKPGQRVSFVPEPDVRGPKAVQLTVLAEKVEAPAPVPRIGVTVYHDPSVHDDESAIVLDALAAAGYAPRVVDYAATPPARDDLKRLSLLLREADQSLVRRHDPLFFELQLDDRFIADGDFWTAIHEHPSLINGPVVQMGNKARLCRAAGDVRALLGNGDAGASRKPKALSPMLAAMLGAPMPAAPREPEPAPPPPRPAEAVAAEPVRAAVLKPVVKAKAAPTAKKPVEKKPAVKAVPKAAAKKPAAKPKESVKRPAKKK